MASSSDNYMIGKGKVYFRKWTSAPTSWKTGTTYASGDYVMNGDRLWTATAGGSSHTSASGPTGSTGTFTDGTVTWAQVDWIDLGNAPQFKWAAEVETLDHYSSRSGIKTRDKKVIISRKGTLTIVLDEITVENLDLALMGTTTGTAGSREIEIFSAAQVDAQVKLEGTNDVGNQFDWFFGAASFQPGKELSVISDTWAEIELVAEVNADSNDVFGIITEQ